MTTRQAAVSDSMCLSGEAGRRQRERERERKNKQTSPLILFSHFGKHAQEDSAFYV